MAAVEGTVLLNTVDHSKYNYSKRDYTRDLLSRKLQYKISFPSHRYLVKIVEDKVQILNCPLNCDDIRGAKDIWGRGLGCLKGNTPRQKRHTSEDKCFPSLSPSYKGKKI